MHEVSCEEGMLPVLVPQTQNKNSRPSLSKIILSLDSEAEKQKALTHVLTALQITYARYSRSPLDVSPLAFYACDKDAVLIGKCGIRGVL